LVFPVELTVSFGLKLIVQRFGVVVVHQFERTAFGQLVEGFKDERVSDTGRDSTDV
jgi:hypothetical protein